MMSNPQFDEVKPSVSYPEMEEKLLQLWRNRNVFQRNLEGQFAENYDLARTQNLKNKDIPEFGSKGTILLHKEAQAARPTAALPVV